MEVHKSFIQNALDDVNAYATIIGLQLGDEEYVALVEFVDLRDALRFMAALALRLREAETHIGVLAMVAAVEVAARPGRTVVRFRGWELT